jgi:teichuronic acid exporter
MRTDPSTEPKLTLEAEGVTPPDVDPVAEAQDVLDHSLVRSVAWQAASSWLIQIVSWLVSLEVMRLLAPKDFGIAALAIVFFPFLGSIAGLGIPRAVVALPAFTENQLAQLSAVNVIMGSVSLLLGIVIAKPFAAFFRTPPLAALLIVGCVGVLISAIAGVPTALLTKERRFRFLSILGIGNLLLGSLMVLWLASLGYGYWALILGNTISAVMSHIVIICVRPFRLAWPKISSIREPLQFGWHVTVSTFALNAYERLDNFVAARVLGQAALGFYGNAWELANVPMEKVTSLVTVVVPSYLAVVRADPAALRRYLYRLTEVIAVAAFPACTGLGLVARECVPLILGHKWDGMVPPLQVLSFYAAFRSIVALLPKVLTAVGNSGYVMRNDLAALVILPVAFYIGSYRGITGIAWGWVVAYPIVVVPLYKKTFEAIGARVGDYLRSLRPALTGTIAMIPAVEWVKHFLDPSWRLVWRLVIEVSFGALVYSGAVFLLHRQRALLVIQLVKKSLRGKALPATVPSI